ncbi:GNAT family N-acetyltransferase [Flammeovirga agarivorans]|uniref:GNAT family N-acetyltransferase n=1 Tax=Flammeovirga agarivorans TaxID=2726742 RepID=A0A7X8XWF2_9BACT|nr:GNAT family N-acetyltransferase [Flammeovirga agarivorans]NLR92253.1 GNAT family N-acetyltransferase [Flammeovirga agarivorans]
MITIEEAKLPSIEQITSLYKLNGWSAADKPEHLFKALQNSHTLVTAWEDEQLIGLGNAISDSYLVVYFPHLLVHPSFQGKGVGKLLMEKLMSKYEGFHMQMLTSDAEAVEFYQKMGFRKAGDTVPMWIYDGLEH